MTQSPSSFVNSPASGGQYFGKVWAGAIAANGDSVTATVKAWTGANGSGSLIAVSNLEVWVWDFQAGGNVGHFGPGFFNTANAAHTATSGQAGHYFYVAAEFNGAQTVGSFEFFVTYTSSGAFIPSAPSFSPSVGGPGTSVALTGSKFFDASSVDFNGTSASFTVNSDTSITATVPSGASSGAIHVVNGAGTGTSASNFTPSTFRVDNGTSWDTANAVWADDGAGWQLCKVWADNGASWVQIA
jgi:hypothetical protein